MVTKKKAKKKPKLQSLKLTHDQEGASYLDPKKIHIQEGHNPRKDVKPDAELLGSIKINGVLHPLGIRWTDKSKTSVYLVDGERRLNAALKLQLKKVPVIHYGTVDDVEAKVIALASNKDQKPLTKSEQYSAFRWLRDQGLTASQIAKTTHFSKRYVESALRVETKGSDSLKKAARKGSVPTRVAAAAAKLPKKVQEKVVKKVKGKSTSKGLEEVRKETKKRGIKSPGPKPKNKPSLPPAGKGKYKLAKDVADRCERVEMLLQRKLGNNKTHRRWRAMMDLIECLKGKCKPDDLVSFD
jgi:ParB/RepB/Spo0J family partition protein